MNPAGLFFIYYEKSIVEMNNVRDIIGMDRLAEPLPTGKGVAICILDSGIAGHEDFDGRIAAFRDFVKSQKEPYDDYGHGTHIAGICAGSGIRSSGRYRGIAPQSRLVVGKILNREGDGRIEHLVEGIRWCLRIRERFGIRILNISIGLMKTIDNSQQDVLLEYINEAWDRGIVTVCAAGNNGPGSGTVTVPGTQPKVITVGSLERGRYGIVPSRYSGRGPTTDCVLKPEIYAPGREIKSCGKNNGYVKKTGTSMAVPVVSGAIALLLEKQPYLSPVEVKMKLYESARRLDGDGGASWGMLYVPDLLSAGKN